MFAFSRILSDEGLPIPKIYVRAISTRLSFGRSTPAIRAIVHSLISDRDGGE
jgi:hypothetical protein